LAPNPGASTLLINSLLDENKASHYHYRNVKYIIKIRVASASAQWPLNYNENLNPNEFLSMFIYKKG